MIVPTEREIELAARLDPEAFPIDQNAVAVAKAWGQRPTISFTGTERQISAVWRAVAALTKPKHFGDIAKGA